MPDVRSYAYVVCRVLVRAEVSCAMKIYYSLCLMHALNDVHLLYCPVRLSTVPDVPFTRSTETLARIMKTIIQKFRQPSSVTIQ